jgi:poly(hydroxyalkanoate) depolymerase family esterase
VRSRASAPARRRGRSIIAFAFLGLMVARAGDAAEEPRVTGGMYQGRAYRLSTPASPARQAPLVVALHGCAQTPEDFARGTRLDTAAARRGLRVVYPAQGARDNAARCWNWFTTGETGELLALARDGMRDAERIVVLGFSAGGYMAINLACAAPELVSGVGVIAGGPYGCADGARAALTCMRGARLDGAAAAARCRGAGRTRASLWHGERDSVVSLKNLVALTEMFVLLREPRPTGVTERRDGAVHSVYRGADGRAAFETWLVPGMGHAWSGGDPRGTHTFPAGPDATEHMLRFLVDE